MPPDDQITWYITQFINMLFPYAVAAVGITLISITPLGRAAISWLKGHVNRGRAAELETEIERLRLEVAEAQERLDFAERRMLGASGPATEGTAPVPPHSEPRVPTPV